MENEREKEKDFIFSFPSLLLKESGSEEKKTTCGAFLWLLTAENERKKTAQGKYFFMEMFLF